MDLREGVLKKLGANSAKQNSESDLPDGMSLSIPDQFVVNNKILDDQHRLEFQIINRLRSALANGGVVALDAVFQELIVFVMLHFATEEELMAKADYPNLDAHRADHDSLRSKVFDIDRRFRKGRRVAACDLLQLLQEWTSYHIPKRDRELSRFLAESAGIQG